MLPGALQRQRRENERLWLAPHPLIRVFSLPKFLLLHANLAYPYSLRYCHQTYETFTKTRLYK